MLHRRRGGGTNLDADHEAKQIIVYREGQTHSLLHCLLLLLERSLQRHHTQYPARVNFQHTMAGNIQGASSRHGRRGRGWAFKTRMRGGVEKQGSKEVEQAGADGARRQCP